MTIAFMGISTSIGAFAQTDSIKVAKPTETVNVRAVKSYKADRVSSTSRITTSLLETPQNITVLTKQVFQDQQIFSPTDLARNVSGVSSVFPFPTIYTDLNIRGTRATQSKFRNGISTGTASFGMLMEDMSYVETAEFIKGPAGFMIGQGEPGGLYNIVTKKPSKEAIRTATMSVGSFGLFRGHLDLGGKLTDDGKLSFRLNTMLQRSGTHVDFQTNNRLSIAPVLRYELNDKTSVLVELNYDEAQTRNSDPAIPSVDGQFLLPRNFSVSDPNIAEPNALRHIFGFTQMQHHFDENWLLTAQLGVSEATWQGFDITIRDSVAGSGRNARSVRRQARYIDRRSNNVSGQVFLNGLFKTGDIEHNLLVGVDAGLQQFKQVNFVRNNVLPIANVFAPTYTATQIGLDTLVRPSTLNFTTPSLAQWEALYLQNTVKFTSWAHLTLAGRLTNARSGAAVLKSDLVFTPRVGVTVMPLNDLAVYGLYDESFLPIAGRSFAGEEFRPLRGSNLEFGVKRDWFEGKLSTNLTWFSIQKTNALTADPMNTGFQIQTGEIASTGVELDVIGTLFDGFSIIANYAYTDARITKDTRSELVGRREQAPLHNANLWASYRVQEGALKGFGVGLGVSYMAQRYILTLGLTDAAQQAILPDFRKLDAALYYTLGDLSFALNVDNLTNELNIFGTFDRNLRTWAYMPQAGTNWRMTVSVKF